MPESHTAMLHTFSCSGYRWLYILLIILGGVPPGLARVLSVQAQTHTPVPETDPDNAEHVALGQQKGKPSETGPRCAWTFLGIACRNRQSNSDHAGQNSFQNRQNVVKILGH